jgi:esterase/lipase superfamily enzyme
MPLPLFIAIITALLTVPAEAGAQSSRSSADPRSNSACAPITAEQAAQLAQSQTQQEARIERLRAPGIADSDASLRAAQTELMTTLVALDCSRQQSQVIRTRALGLAKSHLLSATVYYATNRRWKSAAAPADQYGSEFSDNVELGATSIALPTDRNPIEQALPHRWTYTPSSDRSWRAKLEQVTRVGDVERGRGMLEHELKDASSKSLLLFVHGFWTTFEDAAVRAAQTAHDIGFPGLVMFYSWPSQGSLTGYWRDEEMVQLSAASFDDTLQLIAKLGVTDVYLIANSMGARLVGQVLADRVAAGKSSGPLRELLFAAADVNAELFRRQIAPKVLQMKGTRVTIYSSSKDIALQTSKVIHKSPRVGETDAGIFTHAGMETIDASGTASVWRAFGHSYISDSPRVLRDFAELFGRRIGAAQRGLPVRGTEPHQYWWLD